MIDDINKIKECPDCASMNIVYSISRDQVICKDCGLIFEPLAPGIEEIEQSQGVNVKIAKSSLKKRGRPPKIKKTIKKIVKKTKKKVNKSKKKRR